MSKPAEKIVLVLLMTAAINADFSWRSCRPCKALVAPNQSTAAAQF